MRSLTTAVAIGLVTVLACLEPAGAPSMGGLSLTISASPAALDSGRVIVSSGSFSKTVKLAPGQTVTIDGLNPGTYTVGLQGFARGAVAFFTQLTGISVVAGQNANATVASFPSFQTSIISIPSFTADGHFVLVYSKIPAAASYIVQKDASPSFASPQETTIAANDTSPELSVPTTGPYYVRVLAVDAYGARGVPSAPSTVTTITSVTVDPATAGIAPGETKQFSAVAKDAQGNPITGVTFFWASSKQNVALVDPQTGLATGVALGTATITALGLGLPGNAALTVQITPGTPAKLGFIVPPAGGDPNLALAPAVQVAIQDQFGNTVPSANNPVTVALATNPTVATLSGTPTVIPTN